MTRTELSRIFTAAHSQARSTDFETARDARLAARDAQSAARSKSQKQAAAAAFRLADAAYEAAEDFRGMTYRQRFAAALKAQYAATKKAQQAQQVSTQGGYATARQISYLRDLGYTGNTAISKAEASRRITGLLRITREDNDDFRAERHEWFGVR